jgi:hypothetical protein
MIVLVCGSRDWTDIDIVYKRLQSLPSSTTIVHGGCRGADMIADSVAKKLGLNIKCFPAEWNKHGKSAGPKRNQKMIDETNPELVIAFHQDIESSRGTKDMINRAKLHQINFEIISNI